MIANCPSCGRAAQVSNSFSGEVRCPVCRRKFSTVDLASTTTPSGVGPAPAPPPPRTSPVGPPAENVRSWKIPAICATIILAAVGLRLLPDMKPTVMAASSSFVHVFPARIQRNYEPLLTARDIVRLAAPPDILQLSRIEDKELKAELADRTARADRTHQVELAKQAQELREIAQEKDKQTDLERKLAQEAIDSNRREVERAARLNSIDARQRALLAQKGTLDIKIAKLQSELREAAAGYQSRVTEASGFCNFPFYQGQEFPQVNMGRGGINQVRPVVRLSEGAPEYAELVRSLSFWWNKGAAAEGGLRSANEEMAELNRQAKALEQEFKTVLQGNRP
ncbi:MAG TPA: hypothetical protein VHY91_11720 [Pirellulales bacterium]|nr:hypothetical protein [Pirellulales bacterium]